MNKLAFTLIELLIVLVIISALVGTLVPMFRTNKVTAQIAKANTDLDAVKTASMMYHHDTGFWPPTGSNGGGLIGTPTVANWAGPYLDRWSADPWGISYMIYDTGTSRRARSYGPDKVVGGTDNIEYILTPDTSW